MRDFILYCMIGGVAGGASQKIIHLFFDLPFPVEGCIAGSVGYMAAWSVEMWRNRKPTFNMEWWGR